MAGSFGFEAGKFDVSIACGERVLLPAIRRSTKDTLIIADGFSCREQIQQRTDRHALHLAEVIQIALRSGPRGPEGLEGPRPSGRDDLRASGLRASGARDFYNRSSCFRNISQE
jgi:hypothetical protein